MRYLLFTILFLIPSTIQADVVIGNFTFGGGNTTPNNAVTFNGQVVLFNGQTVTFTHS